MTSMTSSSLIHRMRVCARARPYTGDKESTCHACHDARLTLIACGADLILPPVLLSGWLA